MNLLQRRAFVRSMLAAASAPAMLAACLGSDDNPMPTRHYLLVHGAWHSSAHWNLLIAALSAMCHRALAIDLPGNGVHAGYPVSYQTQDLAALATEVSAVKDVTLQQQADAIVDAIGQLHALGGPVVVVAHSAGGAPATLAVEAVPQLVRRVIYLSAYCPVARPNLGAYLGLPENAAGLGSAGLIGDFNGTGAFRINPRAADLGEIEKLRAGYYSDLTLSQARPFLNLCTPDLPAHQAIDEVHPTAARWGSVRRSFIRCAQDRALPLALQDLMITEADAFTPHNRFQVETIQSSHSPFASRPGELAALLSAIG